MQKINSFPYEKAAIGGKSSLPDPLIPPTSDIPDFESGPEAKTFMIFFDQLMEETNNQIRLQHHQKIREKIKLNIPLMKNLEEFKNLYSKTFLRRKK